ncbi:cellulase family glycosylhydrolase [Angustibacter aerolatus]
MRFGANYTPSQGWFHAWLDLDLDAVARDLDAVAALGLDHVRLFPLWSLLQPNRTLIRERALADVRAVAEVAQRSGLDVSVDVVQGHLSSFDFLPSWVTTWHTRNLFTDDDVVEALEQLVGSVHGALADLPGYLGLTLGNELNQFSGAPHPNASPATPAQVESWLRRLLGAVPDDASTLRLHAPYDAAFYLDGHPFTPAHASRLGDVTAVHSWVFNGTAQAYGPESVQSRRHAEYLIELSTAFAVDAGRPVWLQEVGAPLNVMDTAQAPDFVRETVRAAADCPDLWGVTWWCSHDVDRSLADFPDLEHTLGLHDAGGTVKPVGRAFAEVAAEVRASSAPPPRGTAVVVEVDDDDLPLHRGDCAPGGRVFTAWMQVAADGGRPTVVTSRTAADAGALAARGVTDVVHPEPGGASVYAAVPDTERLSID